MGVRIATPPGTTELVDRRTRNGKTFDLGSGKRRTISDAGAAHWHDGQTWQDVDCEWEPIAGGRFGVRSAMYLADFDPATCTLRYTSRTLGDLRVKLLTVGGLPPAVVTPQFDPKGERMKLIDIGLGASLMLVAAPNFVEIFRRYTTTLPPIVWEVSESPSLGVIQTNILQMSGKDNWDQSAVSRVSETTPRNVRRWVEVDLVKGPTTIVNGRPRYIVTEQLTGRTRWRDPVTRLPEWRNEIEFPILMDVQVVEDIVADNDDGFGYIAGASETWFGEYNGLYFDVSFAPAWRWTTVDVPQAATIDAASIRVYVENAGDTSASMIGDDADTAAAWANNSANGPNRMTATSAAITFDGFSATGFASRTVTTIVQEIVNRGGWVANNAMRLGCLDAASSSDNVRFSTFDYVPSQCGRLTIDYTAGGAGSVIPVFMHQYRQRRN